jgi:hypothetical protein
MGRWRDVKNGSSLRSFPVEAPVSNRSLALLLVGLLLGLAGVVAFHIGSDGPYAGLFVGVYLVPMAMISSALVCLACGLRSGPDSGFQETSVESRH